MSRPSPIHNHSELLRAFQKETLRLLDEQSRLLGDLEEAEISLGEQAGKLRNDLANERHKVENLTMTVAVVGTMKAGKSTLLNAIMGEEILPSRETGMTAIPLVITHHSELEQPELHISNVDVFNRAARDLNTVLKSLRDSGGDEAANKALQIVGERDAAFLRKHFPGAGWQFDPVITGPEKIREALQVMNDLLRICSDMEGVTSPLAAMVTYADLPELRARFSSFTAKESGVKIGKLAFIDTPGPNEAAQQQLKGIVDEQLTRASAIILVLNFTQLNTQADADLRKQVQEIVLRYPDQVHVVVNRYDEKDNRSMNVDQLKEYVSTSLFPSADLPEDRVLPVSARRALLATKALSILNRGDTLPEPTVAPWIQSFGEALMGMDWDEEIQDPVRVRRCAERGMQKSLFTTVTSGVVEHAFDNSASGSLRSALAKICAFFSPGSMVHEALRANQAALRADMETLHAVAQKVERCLLDLERVQQSCRSKIEQAPHRLAEALDSRKASLIDRLQFSQWVKDGQELSVRETQSIWHRSITDVLNEVRSKVKGLYEREFDLSETEELRRETEKAMEGLRGYAAKECEQFCADVNTASRALQSELNTAIEAEVSPLRTTLADLLQEHLNLVVRLPEFRFLNDLTGGLDPGSFSKIVRTESEVIFRERPWYFLWLFEVERKKTVTKQSLKLDLEKLENALRDLVAGIVQEAQRDFGIQAQRDMDEYASQIGQQMRVYRDALSQQKDEVLCDEAKKQERAAFLDNLDKRRSEIHRDASETLSAVRG